MSRINPLTALESVLEKAQTGKEIGRFPPGTQTLLGALAGGAGTRTAEANIAGRIDLFERERLGRRELRQEIARLTDRAASILAGRSGANAVNDPRFIATLGQLESLADGRPVAAQFRNLAEKRFNDRKSDAVRIIQQKFADKNLTAPDPAVIEARVDEAIRRRRNPIHAFRPQIGRDIRSANILKADEIDLSNRAARLAERTGLPMGDVEEVARLRKAGKASEAGVRLRELKGAQIKSRLLKTGIGAGVGATVGALVLPKIIKSISNTVTGADEERQQRLQELALAAQIQGAQGRGGGGDMLGADLRNVSRLLGILKMIGDLGGLQGSPSPQLSAIV